MAATAHLESILAMTDGIEAIEAIGVVIGVIDATGDEADHLVGRTVMAGMRMHMLRAVVIGIVSAKIVMGVPAAAAAAVVAVIVGNVNGTATVATAALGETAVATMVVDLPDATATYSRIDVATDGIVIELSETEMTISSRRTDEHAARHRRPRSESRRQTLPISFPF